MTWNAFHHRGEILREAMSVANSRVDGTLPLQVPGVSDAFGDELDLLSALMLRWHTRLAGNIERTLAEQPLDLEAAVVDAWRDARDQMPGVRAIMDRLAEDNDRPELASAVRRARQREWSRLAIAAGLANAASPSASRAGHALEERARAAQSAAVSGPRIPEQNRAAAASTSQETPGRQVSLVDRIKAVLAA